MFWKDVNFAGEGGYVESYTKDHLAYSRHLHGSLTILRENLTAV
jgi:hypothetical protein